MSGTEDIQYWHAYEGNSKYGCTALLTGVHIRCGGTRQQHPENEDSPDPANLKDQPLPCFDVDRGKTHDPHRYLWNKVMRYCAGYSDAEPELPTGVDEALEIAMVKEYNRQREEEGWQ